MSLAAPIIATPTINLNVGAQAFVPKSKAAQTQASAPVQVQAPPPEDPLVKKIKSHLNLTSEEDITKFKAFLERLKSAKANEKVEMLREIKTLVS